MSIKDEDLTGCEDVEDVAVSCGGVQGKLIMREFICPGIHQRCIEVDGARMTPKAFCVIGDKERLKDWKNAIRINGKSIRRRMYCKDIDFYNHSEICTGRCMSRVSDPTLITKDTKHSRSRKSHNDSVEWSTFSPIPTPLDEEAYGVLREACGSSPAYRPERKQQNPGQVVFPEHQRHTGDVVFPGDVLATEVGQDIMPPDMIKQEITDDMDDHESYSEVNPTGVLHHILNDIRHSTGSSNVPDIQHMLNHTNDIKDLMTSKYRRKSSRPRRLSSEVMSRSDEPSLRKPNNQASPRGNTKYREASHNLQHDKVASHNLLQDKVASHNLLQDKVASHNLLQDKVAARKQHWDKVASLDLQRDKVMRLVAEFPDTDTLFEDSVTFWEGVLDTGVLDSVVRDIKQTVDNIKNDMSRIGVDKTDACRLSAVVRELGLVTKLKWRLAEHKANTETENDVLLQEIQALKQKVALSEKKQEELKRKTRCFDNLLDLSVQPSKRQHVSQAASTDDDNSNHSNHNGTSSPACSPKPSLSESSGQLDQS